ncbi:nonstructural protein [robinz microvirus RP_131]|nr:nonstructural protein [robinz microvirus RP_131]
MKLQMFTVYDAAVATYMPPFFCRSKGEALRSFGDACNSAESNFNKYSSDYTLFYVGEYDDAGADFYPVVPVRIISALECIVDSVVAEPPVSKPRLAM